MEIGVILIFVVAAAMVAFFVSRGNNRNR